ncbi:MAG: pseudouridine synthase [Chlamydiales bacterium]
MNKEPKKRLSKALAAAGIASRRASEQLIFDGNVTVNGKIVLVPQTMVSWENDQIQVNGKLVSGEEKKVYYMLNKPTGYICSNKPVGTKKLVIDLFEPLPERLFSIGRLDRDTTGLLLMTNDGHFAQKVIHPSAHIQKEYLVKVHEEISHEHLVTISRGTEVEETWVKPVRVTKVRRGTVKVVVMEGKKREVRYLVEKAGLTILSLERVRIGGLILGPLPLGSFRPLTDREKTIIFKT